MIDPINNEIPPQHLNPLIPSFNTLIPSPTKTISLKKKKFPVPGLGKDMNKISLENIVVPEGKLSIKDS